MTADVGEQIQLAHAKKLEDIHATILSVKAKANHAQQVSSSAINMASAATAATAAASRMYAQTAAATPELPLRTAAQVPRANAPDPRATPATAPTNARSTGNKPTSATAPLPSRAPAPTNLLSRPAQTFRPRKTSSKDPQRPYPLLNTPSPGGVGFHYDRLGRSGARKWYI